MGKFGKMLGDMANDLSKKVGEQIEKLDDTTIGKKIAEAKETWDNVDPDTKKDIKYSAATGTGGILVGGPLGLIGIGYAAKKARDAYKREKEKKNYNK